MQIAINGKIVLHDSWVLWDTGFVGVVGLRPDFAKLLQQEKAFNDVDQLWSGEGGELPLDVTISGEHGSVTFDANKVVFGGKSGLRTKPRYVELNSEKIPKAAMVVGMPILQDLYTVFVNQGERGVEVCSLAQGSSSVTTRLVKKIVKITPPMTISITNGNQIQVEIDGQSRLLELLFDKKVLYLQDLPATHVQLTTKTTTEEIFTWHQDTFHLVPGIQGNFLGISRTADWFGAAGVTSLGFRQDFLDINEENPCVGEYSVFPVETKMWITQNAVVKVNESLIFGVKLYWRPLGKKPDFTISPSLLAAIPEGVSNLELCYGDCVHPVRLSRPPLPPREV